MRKIRDFFSELTVVREIILAIIPLVIFFTLKWIFLPVNGGWGFLWISLLSVIFTGIYAAVIIFDDYEPTFVGAVHAIAAIIIVIVMIVFGIGGSPMAHADEYANTFKPIVVETQAEDIPSFEDVEKVALMDTSSARKLGDRTVGSLTEYVSQFNVSNSYCTISYNGRVVKVAPLEHASFFKANKNETIPGYVIVDCLKNEAEFVKVEKGMKYSPSAYFDKDLIRHIRTKYKKEVLGDYYNFQIDEEGTPYWVISVTEYKVWKSAKVPVGAIIVNAIDGSMEKYALKDIPKWVEQVYDGDMVSTLYNRYGKYLNGFPNLSDEGKTQVTRDYGYLEKDGDIFIYTGVTSVVADESNIGFILVNSRTGECKYYAIAGAEEYSAMAAAEGVVQNFGYEASFPSLVMYKDTPTYVMVLKDANGLVKKYAMVNMVHYSVVVVEDTLEKCKKSYIDAINKNTEVSENTTEDLKEIKETITIESINYINIDGETYAYIKSTDGKFFKQSFKENEKLICFEVGNVVDIKYYEMNKNDITPITSIEITEVIRKK